MRYSILFGLFATVALGQVTRDNNGLSTTPADSPTDGSDAANASPTPMNTPTAAQWPAYSAQPTTQQPGYYVATPSTTWDQSSWTATQAPNPHYTGPVPTTGVNPVYGTAAQQSSWAGMTTSTWKVSVISASYTKSSSAQQATFTGGAQGREVYLGFGAVVAGIAAVL